LARHRFLAALAVILAVVVMVAGAACSSSADETTTTVAPTPTTASSATSVPAGTATQPDYMALMAAWVTGVLQKLDTSVFDIVDPANATPEQIAAVAAFVSQAKAALEQLKAIVPSAEAEQLHNQFTKLFEDLVAATDEYVEALRSKSLSALAAVEQSMSNIQTQIQEAIAGLAPIIGLAPPAT